jgi:hypothetical protein
MRQIAAEFLPFQMPGGQTHGLLAALKLPLFIRELCGAAECRTGFRAQLRGLRQATH